MENREWRIRDEGSEENKQEWFRGWCEVNVLSRMPDCRRKSGIVVIVPPAMKLELAPKMQLWKTMIF
jgi:hypothetical protein